MIEPQELITICCLDGDYCDRACDRYGIGCDPIEIVRPAPNRDETEIVVDLGWAWPVDEEGNRL